MVRKQAHRVFLSFAHGLKDEQFARQLAAQLRTQGFETEPGPEDAEPGSNWALAVGRALERSDAIVAIVSKDYLDSPWAQKEWEYALTSRKHAGRVVPVILRGTPDQKVPWIVHNVPHVKASADLSQVARQVVAALSKELGETG